MGRKTGRAGWMATTAIGFAMAAVAAHAHAQAAGELGAPAQVASLAQPAGPDNALSEVIVTGTRETTQTQFTALSPVDSFSAKAIHSTVTTNLDETLAQLVPSFDVKRLPAADGPEFIKPAALDGLSPDMTLVLLNGKRFHNSAFGQTSGQSAASQGPDLAQIPTFALGRVEVLRDGASAQYGSDAIAGVINLILDTRPGFDLFVQGSQFYAGDGSAGAAGVRAATALPGGGHVMVTGEYSTNGETSRSIQRPDAIAFQAANPTLQVPNPVQHWGNPEQTTGKAAFDAAEPIGSIGEAYVFGTLGIGSGIADINWRNPAANPTIYGTNPAVGPSPTIFPGFNLNSIYPDGFTPREGIRYSDEQVNFGLRHKTGDTFTWDVSGSWGHNDSNFFLNRSINASLGPASPTAFNLGHDVETEFDLNADADYQLRTGFLHDPINIAFGVERREETFQIVAGDTASYAVGPGAVAGLAPAANGFPGFNPQQAGTNSEVSYAGYFDVQAPLTKKWGVEFAARDESFDLFGNTFNYKFASRYEITPELAVRGSYSTGFKAPTPEQLFSTSTNQSLDSKTLMLFTSGRLSPLNPVAKALGAKPLTPETSEAVSGGLVWKTGWGFSGSIDGYKIDVDKRLQASPSIVLTPAQIAALVATGVAGAGNFSTVSFFTNAFNTSTTGVDVVGAYIRHVGPGSLNLTGAYSYTHTEVTSGSLNTVANATNKVVFEQGIPQHNATATATYTLGKVELLARLRYYGPWTDTSGNATGDIFQNFGGVAFFDLGVTYHVTPALAVKVGAENVGDTYPDKATNQASRGLLYSRNSPYDTNGGNYYLRLEARY